MKPRRIFIVRHGESQGNVNKELYKTVPDYALRLTEKGWQQAEAAGVEIANIIGNDTCAIYHSPFFRTRDTTAGILKSVRVEPQWIREDVRLREQEWSGKLRENGFMHEAEDERDAYGHSYYRFDGGESCADTLDRVSDMLDTVHRDFEKDEFPQNCVFVGHGMTNRVLLWRWFHLSVEEFESLRNPKNGEVWRMEIYGNGYLGNKPKYRMLSPIRKYPEPTCKFLYPFDNGLEQKLVFSKQVDNQPNTFYHNLG